MTSCAVGPSGVIQWTPRAPTYSLDFMPSMTSTRTGSHLQWVRSHAALSGQACDDIVRLCSQFKCEETRVVGEEQLRSHRVADVRMVPDVPETQSLYSMLWAAALDATTRYYDLAIDAIVRVPQYVEYRAGHGHFHWHNDYSHESKWSPRKLTVILQLSDAAQYEGGDLEVFDSTSPEPTPRERGVFICLPSFVPHRVTAVTRGVRRALVAWIAGPRLI